MPGFSGKLSEIQMRDRYTGNGYGVGSGGVRGQRRGFWGQSGRTLFTNSIYYMKIEQVW